MAAAKPGVNRQTFYVSLMAVFIAGFVAGVAFSVFKTGSTVPADSRQAVEDGGPSAQEQQAIINLEAEVTANPENHNAWIQLGHLYFDSDQYQKAIGAYTKSLELHPGSANLWTDLGVMYRRAGDPEKAVESFDQAIGIDPTHQPSQLNKGIVLHFDLGKTAEAVAVWQNLLKKNPDARLANGMPLKDFVEQIKASASGG